ncbi:MAG: preprotein translocase subunit SecG [Planctomycetota bacterium]
METLTLGAAGLGIGVWVMAVGFTLVCIIMMLVILIQKPKGGGLSGAFGGGAGGGGAGDIIGGSRVGDVLTIVTVVCFLIFLGLAMGLTWSTAPVTEVDPPAETASDAGGAGESDEDETQGDD